jgi:hypothetical protein
MAVTSLFRCRASPNRTDFFCKDTGGMGPHSEITEQGLSWLNLAWVPS